MIISVSRRTDIPAFYAEWFMQRIRAQYCTTVNPFNKKQVSVVSLRPEDVDVLVFWTKNAQPLLPYLHELDELGYRYYFQYTINGYGKIFEPNVPELEECIETFLSLSERIGPDKVIWRYDPLILSNRTDVAYHQKQFSHILKHLHSNTRRVVISIVDEYRKAAINFRRLRTQGIEIELAQKEKILQLCDFMSRQAAAVQIPIFSCAETFNLSSCGILQGKCVDSELILRLFGLRTTPEKDKSQRRECGCVKSKDIGTYDTCLHGCAYCYAGTLTTALRKRERYKPDEPVLIK